MVQMVGKYTHDKNENLDEYFKACGVPFIARKMMSLTSPLLEIRKSDCDDGEMWTISSSTMLRTHCNTFKLGVEYEEHMPGVSLKSTTTLVDDQLVTVSISPDGAKVTRIYEFTDSQCILTMKHESSGIEAKRYFNRVQ